MKPRIFVSSTYYDLKYIRNVIYVDEIKNAGLEYVFEKALKKLGLP